MKIWNRLLPHKFKIGATGCFNNCLKAEENDIGIKGALKPEWIADKCIFCKACERRCPTKAIHVEPDKKILMLDHNLCIRCGRCVKVCPSKAYDYQKGYLIFFGGLFGNKIVRGKQLLPMIFDKEQLFQIVETTLNFFEEHGKTKERFSNTMNRVGWELLSERLEKIV